ncbi:hypothetical protein IT575_12110 [bacterium]|nr:hypothetical protein [bacterium]
MTQRAKAKGNSQEANRQPEHTNTIFRVDDKVEVSGGDGPKSKWLPAQIKGFRTCSVTGRFVADLLLERDRVHGYTGTIERRANTDADEIRLLDVVEQLRRERELQMRNARFLSCAAEPWQPGELNTIFRVGDDVEIHTWIGHGNWEWRVALVFEVCAGGDGRPLLRAMMLDGDTDEKWGTYWAEPEQNTPDKSSRVRLLDSTEQARREALLKTLQGGASTSPPQIEEDSMSDETAVLAVCAYQVGDKVRAKVGKWPQGTVTRISPDGQQVTVEYREARGGPLQIGTFTLDRVTPVKASAKAGESGKVAEAPAPKPASQRWAEIVKPVDEDEPDPPALASTNGYHELPQEAPTRNSVKAHATGVFADLIAAAESLPTEQLGNLIAALSLALAGKLSAGKAELGARARRREKGAERASLNGQRDINQAAVHLPLDDYVPQEDAAGRVWDGKSVDELGAPVDEDGEQIWPEDLMAQGFLSADFTDIDQDEDAMEEPEPGATPAQLPATLGEVTPEMVASWPDYSTVEFLASAEGGSFKCWKLPDGRWSAPENGPQPEPGDCFASWAELINGDEGQSFSLTLPTLETAPDVADLPAAEPTLIRPLTLGEVTEEMAAELPPEAELYFTTPMGFGWRFVVISVKDGVRSWRGFTLPTSEGAETKQTSLTTWSRFTEHIGESVFTLTINSLKLADKALEVFPEWAHANVLLPASVVRCGKRIGGTADSPAAHAGEAGELAALLGDDVDALQPRSAKAEPPAGAPDEENDEIADAAQEAAGVAVVLRGGAPLSELKPALIGTLPVGICLRYVERFDGLPAEDPEETALWLVDPTRNLWTDEEPSDHELQQMREDLDEYDLFSLDRGYSGSLAVSQASLDGPFTLLYKGAPDDVPEWARPYELNWQRRLSGERLLALCVTKLEELTPAEIESIPGAFEPEFDDLKLPRRWRVNLLREGGEVICRARCRTIDQQKLKPTDPRANETLALSPAELIERFGGCVLRSMEGGYGYNYPPDPCPQIPEWMRPLVLEATLRRWDAAWAMRAPDRAADAMPMLIRGCLWRDVSAEQLDLLLGGYAPLPKADRYNNSAPKRPSATWTIYAGTTAWHCGDKSIDKTKQRRWLQNGGSAALTSAEFLERFGSETARIESLAPLKIQPPAWAKPVIVNHGAMIKPAKQAAEVKPKPAAKSASKPVTGRPAAKAAARAKR